MPAFDWKQFGDEVVLIVRDAIGTALSPVTARLDALEAKKPERGEKGDPGDKGEKGDRGEAGEPGQAGPQGEPGPRGDSGSPGEKGQIGEQGLKGEPGRDGRDGSPGRDGKDGAPGLNGKDGSDGINGKDGLGFDDIHVEHDGERGFKFAFIRGDQRKEFGAFTIPSVIYRGVWKEGEYKKGDAVTWAGSMFVAEGDTSTKPEAKDSAWRLSVKRGKDGINGKDGKLGAVG